LESVVKMNILLILLGLLVLATILGGLYIYRKDLDKIIKSKTMVVLLVTSLSLGGAGMLFPGDPVIYAPTNMVSTGYSNYIHIAWTQGVNTDTTRLESHTTSDDNWNPGDHTLMQNSSADFDLKISLSACERVYFKAWGWNETYGYSATGTTTVNNTFCNDLDVIDSDTTGGEYFEGVWSDGTYIYNCKWTNGLTVYNFDGIELTSIDNDFQAAIIYYRNCWGNSSYIFVAGWSKGIAAYTFDGNTLTYKNIIDNGGTYYDVWANESYVFAACGDDGLRAYTFNGTDFSLKDTIDNGGTYKDVWIDDEGYIYTACDDTLCESIKVYTFDGSDFTLISEGFCDDHVSIFGDYKYIYTAEENVLSMGVSSFDYESQTLSDVIRYHSDEQNGSRVFATNKYVYLGCEDNDTGSLIVYNNLAGYGTSLNKVGQTTDCGTNILGLWSNDDYIYVSSYTDGLYVLDGYGWVNSQPALSHIDPYYDETGVSFSPTITVYVEDPNIANQTVNVTWQYYDTDHWYTFGTNLTLSSNQTIRQPLTNVSDYNTLYKIKFLVNDSVGVSMTIQHQFTSVKNPLTTPPVITSISPVNKTYTFGSDVDEVSAYISHEFGQWGTGDSWSIECNNGDSDSGTVTNNKTITLTLDTALSADTLYTWWINISDKNGNVANETIYFNTGYPDIVLLYDGDVAGNSDYCDEFISWKEDTSNFDTGKVNIQDILTNSSYWVNGTWGDNTEANPYYISQTIANYSLYNQSQHKIRNFIRYADSNGVDYIILMGGDGQFDYYQLFWDARDNVLAPFDVLFFSCLNGTQNSFDKGADYYGAEDSSTSCHGIQDRICDIIVSRLPYETDNEFGYILDKSQTWESELYTSDITNRSDDIIIHYTETHGGGNEEDFDFSWKGTYTPLKQLIENIFFILVVGVG